MLINTLWPIALIPAVVYVLGYLYQLLRMANNWTDKKPLKEGLKHTFPKLAKWSGEKIHYRDTFYLEDTDYHPVMFFNTVYSSLAILATLLVWPLLLTVATLVGLAFALRGIRTLFKAVRSLSASSHAHNKPMMKKPVDTDFFLTADERDFVERMRRG